MFFRAKNVILFIFVSNLQKIRKMLNKMIACAYFDKKVVAI